MSVISAGVCVQQEKVEGLIANSFGRLKPFIDQGEEVKSTASALSTAWIEFQICRAHIQILLLLLFYCSLMLLMIALLLFFVSERGFKTWGRAVRYGTPSHCSV